MLTELTTCTTADGVMLDGALYAAPRPAPSAAQVLVVHGLGWNFYQGPSRWLPPRLAAMGYTTLSINLRDHDLKEPKDFDLAYHDLRAGVDFLYGHGAEDRRRARPRLRLQQDRALSRRCPATGGSGIGCSLRWGR